MNPNHKSIMITLIAVTIALTLCIISILLTAEHVSRNVIPYQSIMIDNKSCFVNGNNIQFAVICSNYMSNKLYMNYTISCED